MAHRKDARSSRCRIYSEDRDRNKVDQSMFDDVN
jgi:hypothetical protein